MSKNLSNYVRSDDAFAIIHLFEFDMYDFEGNLDEVLRFTDHEMFVKYNTNDYTPLSITFDRLNEDFSMSSDSVSLSIDNINGELTREALASEWRNNKARIIRFIYTPNAQSDGADYYDYGIIHSEDINNYPYIHMDYFITAQTTDAYYLFNGVIDTFSATEQALTATLTTPFVHWNKPYPSRTYNQNEFTSIVGAMSDMVYWGRQNIV